MTYLEQLDPGERFRVLCTGREGTLVGLSAGAASIKYDGLNHRQIKDAEGAVQAEFEAPNRPIIVARRTEVERIP